MLKRDNKYRFETIFSSDLICSLLLGCMVGLLAFGCRALSEAPPRKSSATVEMDTSSAMADKRKKRGTPTVPKYDEEDAPRKMDAGLDRVNPPPRPPANRYPWLTGEVVDTIARRFSPPEGFGRIRVAKNSFADWLRNLPLLSGKPDVLLFNGSVKANQNAHEAVVDIDVGRGDLQQCADAVMRLRAEYLRVSGKGDEICFRFTNGSDAVWRKWRSGYRPKLEGRRVTWQRRAKPGGSYSVFRKYLVKVFQYAGTASLEKEMPLVKEGSPIAAGNVFIKGGFPGHAVLVADVAENDRGERVFLLLQSYMPAQQMHILKNPQDKSMSPWYRYVPSADLSTPEWHFERGSLRRFSNRRCDR